MSAPASPPVRVDKALGLLPELEALVPLRALLVSIARPADGALWASSGPYLTLGKRGIQPDELARRMPQAFHQSPSISRRSTRPTWRPSSASSRGTVQAWRWR